MGYEYCRYFNYDKKCTAPKEIRIFLCGVYDEKKDRNPKYTKPKNKKNGGRKNE